MPNQRSKISRICIYCRQPFFPFSFERTPQRFCSRHCRWTSANSVTAEQVFWSYVTKTDGCWTWGGSHSSNGYPRFKIRGRHVAAHRFALELSIGRALIKGEQANHECDNPGCVRVHHEHVCRGTQKQNIQHAMSKFRMAVQRHGFHKASNTRRGILHPQAKLNDSAVREIRRLRATGLTQPAICVNLKESHGITISQPVVSQVLLGKLWKHVE